MNWLDIGKQVLGLGLPILGTALGGPLGGAAGNLVAQALGVPATPEAVGAALTNADDVAIAKLKGAEDQYIAQVQAQAALGSAQVTSVAETIKAEVVASSGMTGKLGRFIEFMQLSWRPFFAFETLFECCAMAIIFGHEVWTADFSTLTAILQFQGFLSWYFSMKFGLLGVYSIGHSAEKINDASSPVAASIPTDMITRIINAVKNHK